MKGEVSIGGGVIRGLPFSFPHGGGKKDPAHGRDILTSTESS